MYEKSGGDPEIFKNSDVTSLVVSGNRVLVKNASQGIHIEVNELDNGVEVFLEVDENQVKTLMARGLTESEAVDVIVKGLLK